MATPGGEPTVRASRAFRRPSDARLSESGFESADDSASVFDAAQTVDLSKHEGQQDTGYGGRLVRGPGEAE